MPRLGPSLSQAISEDRGDRFYGPPSPAARSPQRAAERLLLSSTAVPLRAADALHLALAQQEADAGTVITYDLRLAEAARAFGMAVHR